MCTYIYVDYLATSCQADKYIIVRIIVSIYMYLGVYMHTCANIISVACEQIFKQLLFSLRLPTGSMW